MAYSHPSQLRKFMKPGTVWSRVNHQHPWLLDTRRCLRGLSGAQTMKARQLIEVEDPKTIFRQAQKRKPVTIDDIATNEQPGADPEYVWQALWKNPFIIANRRLIRGCPLGTGRGQWAAIRDLIDRTNRESGTEFYFQFAHGYTAPAQPRQEGWLQGKADMVRGMLGKESWLQGKVDMVRNLFNRDEIGLVKNTEKGWRPSYQRTPGKSGKTRFMQPKTRYDDEAKTWNVESARSVLDRVTENMDSFEGGTEADPSFQAQVPPMPKWHPGHRSSRMLLNRNLRRKSFGYTDRDSMRDRRWPVVNRDYDLAMKRWKRYGLLKGRGEGI
jgi:hypothetical protein